MISPPTCHSTAQRRHLRLSLSLLVLGVAASAQAQIKPNPPTGPDCSKGWPTDMAFTYLKNAGLTTNEKVDFSKTKTIRLASERLKPGLWHQVYDVRFTDKSGNVIEVIAIHNASLEECSVTEPEIYVISRRLGALK